MKERPHGARIYDCVLGDTTTLAVDRDAGDAVMDVFPLVPGNARQNRAFTRRTVHRLAAEHGIRQILDIGPSIPTASDLHQVAQAAAPELRVAHVDNDPIVLAQAGASTVGTPPSRTTDVDGDILQPHPIFEVVETGGAAGRPQGRRRRDRRRGGTEAVSR
ncbi:SAM-dependent methyltransferase [Actinomycetes bacterium KLBMP 9759]